MGKKKTKQTVREATLDYLVDLFLKNMDGDNPFTGEDLREYCFAHCDEHDPQSPVHALRFFKTRGVLDYECTNRSKGEYVLSYINMCVDPIDALSVEPYVMPANGNIH